LSLQAPGAIKNTGGEPNVYDTVNFTSGYLTLGLTAFFTAVVFFVMLFGFKNRNYKEKNEEEIERVQYLIICLENYLEAEKKKAKEAAGALEKMKEVPEQPEDQHE